MTSTLEAVQGLFNVGRFSDALRTLEGVPRTLESATDIDVLRSELLERTGQYEKADELAGRLLEYRDATPIHQARCEFVLGMTKWGTGAIDQAVTHLQRAVSKARASGDLQRLCIAQLRLMVVLADRTGADATDQIFTTVRESTIKLGEPSVTAALHVLVGEIEAKRGLFHSASRHTLLGKKLLSGSPNSWLEAIAENTLAAIAIMQCDLAKGLAHAERARDLSRSSGAAAMHHAALGNLGNLCLLTGHFDRAAGLFEEASTLLPPTNAFANSGLESLARTAFYRGDIKSARCYLEQIDRSVKTRSDSLLYPNRHSRITAIDLMIADEDWPSALSAVTNLKSIAIESKDRILEGLCLLAELEVASHIPDQMQHLLMARLGDFLTEAAPDFFGKYERVLGAALLAQGDRLSAVTHLDRAERTFKSLGSATGQLEVARSRRDIASKEVNPTSASARVVLQDIAGLLLHANKPELIATNLVAVISNIESVTGAAAVAIDSRGIEATLSSYGLQPLGTGTRSFEIGTSRGRNIVVRFSPKNDIESCASLNSIAALLQVVRDLECARNEREQRLTLWPLDDQPPAGDSVVIGEMQRIMTLARKVASTPISVLITGESGTGKEVMARAIHNLSPRAKRPFVPFNCTAIPRELLESQLFGYRRGAFTGADRDHPGLIRAAKDGTLFLDEIGELSLELQPKLLRFLESGEINPLGESTPFNVDVRVVAATNADLAKLVQEGRFREDLYYRLDVIRLDLPPLRNRRDEIPALVRHFLAKAVVEFKKGRVRFTEEAMEQMLLYTWPGNVRQLQNEVRRMVALADTDMVLDVSVLSRFIREEAAPVRKEASRNELIVSLTDKLSPTVARIEREMIRAALQANDGRLEASAKALGISRKGLYLKRQRLGI